MLTKKDLELVNVMIQKSNEETLRVLREEIRALRPAAPASVTPAASAPTAQEAKPEAVKPKTREEALTKLYGSKDERTKWAKAHEAEYAEAWERWRAVRGAHADRAHNSAASRAIYKAIGAGKKISNAELKKLAR